MDLQTSVFLLFSLFTAGHTLSCYVCSGVTGSCSDQTVKTCPSGSYKCVSLTAVTKDGAKIKFKDCVPDCASGSMNLGIMRSSSVCCNTDGCNVQDAPDPSTRTPNGKTCYSCDGQSCLNKLSCTGNEEHCINGTWTVSGMSILVKGCASKSICDAGSSDIYVKGISCCPGNLCNGVQSVSQSFLFLCLSLLSFILLH
ncbi:phospholipase A2 inhibitor and Ly6/PLAUR domain-containing protein-like [Carassius gibelio]|uniref:phospholipase A2 inhibitor and Ly6/PLAUR domain-containing protein-like n=1 Tax=Carassius gibelio TaxID=101364 RepID=UPI0022799093|nr:phospholipase A2 inhibitor and Ly6/PLAUR domain-containing protein-like [Carassius gibelio]